MIPTQFLKLIILFTVVCSQKINSEDLNRLTFGFLPYLSPVKLIEIHKPLKYLLQDSLETEILMISAPSFPEFLERCKEFEYDIIFTAPHMARYLELEYGYRRLVMTQHRGHALFLTKKNNGIESLEDLRGEIIALPPPSAIIHHLAIQTLLEMGMEAELDYTTLITPSHNSALLSIINGKSIAAAMGRSPWNGVKQDYADDIWIFDQSIEIPGFLLMVKPAFSEENRSKITEILENFYTISSGVDYFNTSGLKGFKKIDDKTMVDLDIYVKAIYGE